ncbi:MAG: GspE/PulE/PilB domain-containing protein [Myxococcales bacterium]
MAAIIDLLVKVQILDERQHDAVMSRSNSRSGGHIVQMVAELGYATEGTVARAISVELGLPRIDLSMTPPEPGALALLDARSCANHFVLPVALRENGELLWLAMADPTDQDALGLVRRRTQKRVRPAVAGPTEILRSVRTLYASPNAGTDKREGIDDAKMAAMEIANEDEGAQEEEAPFEVVNVSEDITGESTPLSRIAKQLGVEVPANMPSRPKKRAPIEVGGSDTPAPPIDSQAPKAVTSIPPKTDPRIKQPPPPPLTFEELFAPPAPAAAGASDDLTDEDFSTIEALRSSMEKGALVLRSLAELCVEKGLFTREEMKKRNQQR